MSGRNKELLNYYSEHPLFTKGKKIDIDIEIKWVSVNLGGGGGRGGHSVKINKMGQNHLLLWWF